MGLVLDDMMRVRKLYKTAKYIIYKTDAISVENVVQYVVLHEGKAAEAHTCQKKPSNDGCHGGDLHGTGPPAVESPRLGVRDGSRGTA